MDTDLAERIAARPAIKVTPLDIERSIAGTDFHRLTATLTLCVLTLHNGFTVTGESACASPENYDQAIGEQIALKNAKENIWPLLGFELRSKLALSEDAPVGPRAGMGRFVGTKALNAMPLTRGGWCHLRGWAVPADEDAADDGYLVEYTDELRPNVAGFDGYVSWSPKDVFERSYQQVG